MNRKENKPNKEGIRSKLKKRNNKSVKEDKKLRRLKLRD